MNSAFRVLAWGIIAAALTLVLNEIGVKGARLLSAMTIIIIVGVTIGSFSKISLFFSDFLLFEGSGVVFKSIIKIIGVGYIFGVCADVCRELGQTGVATALNTAGRIEIIIISLPFVKEILQTASELLQ